MNVTYYRQRASAGLIITEATQVSEEGIGYPWTPGIHTPEQIAGWQKVTRAVHEEGGLIFCQLFHGGRISHSVFHNGALPVSASAIAATGSHFTHIGMVDFETPRALDTEEIPRVLQDYAHAARCAQEAGFDGVEIHGANGYLPNQFFASSSNQRDDSYGGNVENRARFMLELIESLQQVWDSRRIGIRLSPAGVMGDVQDENPVENYRYLIRRLAKCELAYLHLMGPMLPINDYPQYKPFLTQTIHEIYRNDYPGTLITNGGFDQASGNATLEAQKADLIAYGRLFLSNPDLPIRFKNNFPLAPIPDPQTFYGGAEAGYIDYPAYAV
jgi:N-ethylmaleimide reductase